MTTTLNLVVIRAQDLERSQRFYESLGIQFSRERHGSGPEHLVSQLAEIVFEIYPVGKGQLTTSTRIGFRVKSIQATVDVLLESGAELVTPPAKGMWGIRAVVIDPDGHRVELSELG